MATTDSAQTGSGQQTRKPPIDPLRTAVRFPLHLAATLEADSGTHEAVTEDISATGILFRVSAPLPINTVLRWSFTLPGKVMGGDADVTVHCLGRVVRLVQSPEHWLLGAVIDEYTLGDDHE